MYPLGGGRRRTRKVETLVEINPHLFSTHSDTPRDTFNLTKFLLFPRLIFVVQFDLKNAAALDRNKNPDELPLDCIVFKAVASISIDFLDYLEIYDARNTNFHCINYKRTGRDMHSGVR